MADQPDPRRDPRPIIYAVLDFVHFATYTFILWRVAPPMQGLGNIFWVVGVLFGLVGVLMLIGHPRAWRLAVIGCATFLVLEVILLGLILSSAAFLAGVYGSFGRGGAGMALLVAALSIQLLALVPALQLKFLLTRRGRRSFGVTRGP